MADPPFATLDLAAIEAMIAEERLPPVERWHPPHCGHSGIVIRADGGWWHEGRPIARAALVRLFSRILRREADGSFVLVTPAEKLSIDVERAPFLASELSIEGQGQTRRIAFRLTTGDLVIAGPDHPIGIRGQADAPLPVLLVRAGLEATIARPLFYELAELALDEHVSGPFGLWSDGAFFALEPAA